MDMKVFFSRKLVIAGIVAIVAGGGGYALFWPKQLPPSQRYSTAMVEKGAVTESVSANGTLNPVILVNVGTQISGVVKAIHADFNDKVKEGQILLELDPSLTKAALAQSEASAASARASLDLAQANMKRTQALYKKQYVTKQDVDTAVQALKAAEAQLELAEAQVQRDRINLGYTVIRSPVSGVVVSRMVDVGQTVAASFQTPTLFQIAQDLSKMQIDSNYAEADVGNIRIGQHATFRVDAFPNRTFQGVVRQVRLNPTTQQNVVTYDVVITVDNADQVLLPGMTAYVNITVAQHKDALLVPNAALRFHPSDMGQQRSGMQKREQSQDEGQSGGTTGTVYVLENGRPKPVRVLIGITDSRMSEVLDSTLKPGDRVIVNDLQVTEAPGGSHGMRLF
jgi:HlyD family secretion protein